MNVLSLFDGMSCGQIALNRLGIEYENYFASEIDKYAMKVTMANYPNTIQLGSVVDVDGKSLPKIDLMIGGSPCQSFSFAGSRKGMSTKDEQEILTLDHYLQLKEEGFEFEGQSYLFWEYMRLLNELKPKYFLLENVMMGEKWERILSKAIGVNPIKINSSLVSAQNRERLYWTNIGMEARGLFGDLESIIKQPRDRGILLKDVLQDNPNATYYLSDKMIQYITKQTPDNFKRKLKFSDVDDKAFTLTQSYTQRAGITNYIVEDKKEVGVVRLEEEINGSQSGAIYSVDGKSVSLCANGGGQGAKTGLYKVDEKYYMTDSQTDRLIERTGVDINVEEPKILDVYNKKIKDDGKCITLLEPHHNNMRLVEPINDKYFLSEQQVDKVLGGVDPNITGQAVGKAGYMIGFVEHAKACTLLQRDYKGMNSFGINVVVSPIPVDEKYYLSDKMTEKMVITNESQNIIGHSGTGGQKGIIHNIEGQSSSLCATDYKQPKQILTSKIRRLTPIECERLQTVPDNYTNHVSDTQRYKMLGNGWTIEVIAHILSHIK